MLPASVGTCKDLYTNICIHNLRVKIKSFFKGTWSFSNSLQGHGIPFLTRAVSAVTQRGSQSIDHHCAPTLDHVVPHTDVSKHWPMKSLGEDERLHCLHLPPPPPQTSVLIANSSPGYHPFPSTKQTPCLTLICSLTAQGFKSFLCKLQWSEDRSPSGCGGNYTTPLGLQPLCWEENVLNKGCFDPEGA